MVGNKSNFVGSLPRARGSTKLFMFNYGAIIAEVGPGSQTVRVMGPCNKLNGLLIVFFLCDIWFSSSLAVSQINAKWTIFEICAGQHRPPWLQHCTQGCDRLLKTTPELWAQSIKACERKSLKPSLLKFSYMYLWFWKPNSAICGVPYGVIKNNGFPVKKKPEIWHPCKQP